MKPNIFFITIDSIRADKFFGKKKSSHTPNIDKLIQHGVYFENNISVADGSYTCMGSVFTSLYPFQSGLTTVKSYSKATKIFDRLRKFGYSLYGTATRAPFFLYILDRFDEKFNFPKPGFLYTDSPLQDSEAVTGPSILDRLKSGRMKEPWFNYILLMDLHRSVKYGVPKEFFSEQYGDTDYDKMLSAIDVWLGKFLEHVNLDNTIVVITGDHGDFIPTKKVGYEMTYIPSLFDPGRKVKKKLPKSLHGIAYKLFLGVRFLAVPARNYFLKRKLTPLEMRSLSVRGYRHLWELYDDTVRVPLLISGCGIKKTNQIISQQVRHIDIMPTLAEMIGMPFDYDKVEGRSVLPLIKGEKMDLEPAFIETQERRLPTRIGNSIGVRTDEYKYWRARKNPKKHVELYDLKNDPDELTNLAKQMPDLVEHFENLIREKYKNKHEESYQDEEENAKIEKRMLSMGHV